jgi:hypothetical protein
LSSRQVVKGNAILVLIEPDGGIRQSPLKDLVPRGPRIIL